MKYVGCIVLSVVMTQATFAQTEQQAARRVSDKKMSERLQRDWSGRNSQHKDVAVSWYESNDGGVYGLYDADNQNYMSNYDAQGNYIQTYKKQDWNNNVPTELKSSFDRSSYQSREVKNFWQATDGDQRGYYMELSDGSRLWADDKGKISDVPNKQQPRN